MKRISCAIITVAAKIADFANNRFYDGKLILKNNLPGELRYIDVKNVYDANNRNAYVAEARAIAKTIIEGKYTDVGIVTPFVNQARLINRALRKYGITDVTAGTVHSLQGAERSNHHVIGNFFKDRQENDEVA